MLSTGNSWVREILRASVAVCFSLKHGFVLLLLTTSISSLESVARAQQFLPSTNSKVGQSSVHVFPTLPVVVAASGAENAPDISHSSPTSVSTNPVSSSNLKIPNTKSLPPALSPATSTLLKGSQAFIENRGQFPERVRFQLKTGGKTLWLTNQGIVFDAVRSKPLPAGSKNASTPNASTPNEPSLGLNPASRLQSMDTSKLERLVFSEDFVGANSSPSVEASKPQPGVNNYFFGNDPKKWTTHVRRYEEVVYHGLWDGIDLKLYPNGSNLEQEFIVRPGADLTKVQVSYQGAKALRIADDGSLIVRTAFGELHETKPRIYQEISGQRVAVKGRYKLSSATSYSFEVAHHDTQYALVIDPSLLYSTYLGGSSTESGNAIAVDASGAAYIAGSTQSTNFPTTTGAFQPGAAGNVSDAFVTKMNALGSALIYSTYLGPGSAHGIALDAAGEAYVVGATLPGGVGFPSTGNAYQSCGTGIYATFITKLVADGSALGYSSCLGNEGAGGFGGNGIAVDASGKAYLTGSTLGGFPTTPGAYQPVAAGNGDAFVAVVDPSASGASSLVYSTYLGGSTLFGARDGGNRGVDQGNAVAVDAYGMVYVAGSTGSSDFPVTPGAFQTTFAGPTQCSAGGGGAFAWCTNAFVAKLNPAASGASSLIYSTYLSGSGGAYGNGIAVDSLGNAYVTGATEMGCPRGGPGCIPVPPPFPTTPGAFEPDNLWANSAFVTKLNAAGNGLVYSTLLLAPPYGGYTQANGIAIDTAGDAFVVGAVKGNVLPVTLNAFQSSYVDYKAVGNDGFISEFNPTGSAILYSSYLTGNADDSVNAIAVDAAGDVYVTGSTYSTTFPVTPGAFQLLNASGGGCLYEPACSDAFVTKFPLSSTVFRVLNILPASGGNGGQFTATIFGSGFHAGIQVALSGSGGSDIVANPVTIGPNGLYATATFNLQGLSTGTYDVIVRNSDGTQLSLPGAFTVQQGGSPTVQIEKIATKAVPGREVTYSITVSNSGAVDTGTLLLSEFLDPWFSFITANPVPSTISLGTAPWPPAVVGCGAQYDQTLQWNIPSVPAGSTQSFMYSVNLDGQYPVGQFVRGDACVGPPSRNNACLFGILLPCVLAGETTCEAGLPEDILVHRS